MATRTAAVTGVAAGVPYLAVPPPAGARPDAPIVIGWHLMDAPRTEAAFAAALPLAGLDAWRVYLGLPLCGSRTPPGGPEELMRRGYEDAVLELTSPVVLGAADEFPAALAALRDHLDLGDGPLGLLGGSAGAAVAQLVLAEGDLPASAAVLVSPLVRLRAAIAAMGRQFGVSYRWSPASEEVADRLDFVARAGEIARRRPAVLLVVGEHDEPEFREPAAALRDALAERDGARAELVVVAGMSHALAEEPGIEPAPQTPAAAEVDRHAVRWLRRHLLG